MTENPMNNPVAVIAIILYGLLMIATCIYALRVSKQLKDYQEHEKVERLKHILEYHTGPAPLLGVVTPNTSKTNKKDSKNA